MVGFKGFFLMTEGETVATRRELLQRSSSWRNGLNMLTGLCGWHRTQGGLQNHKQNMLTILSDESFQGSDERRC